MKILKLTALVSVLAAALTLAACGEKVAAAAPEEWINGRVVTLVNFPGEDMQWGDRIELNPPEFPGTTFIWTTDGVTAVNADGDSELLYGGLPVWDVYLRDLTGDGVPEFCSTVSIGSGIVDNRLIVYDYAAGREYLLEDRGYYDYSLSLGEDGLLTVTQKAYGSENEIAKGELKLVDGELTAGGIVRPTETPAEDVPPTGAPDDAPGQLSFSSVSPVATEPTPEPAPPVEIPGMRTAENTLHEAYYNVVKALYYYDPGLNDGIKYIAVDMSNVFEDARAELEENLRELAESLNCELLLNNHEGLAEAGYIDAMPPEGNGEGFREGILFSFDESLLENGTLTVQISKYRGPLGAVYATYSATFAAGGWVVSEPTDIMMS